MNLRGWQVLSRTDCSLCEDMLAALVALLGEAAQQVEVIDIDEHPELARRYGSRIPVLMIDDEVVCCYRLDEARVRGHLADPHWAD